jgi:hypothetical protein
MSFPSRDWKGVFMSDDMVLLIVFFPLLMIIAGGIVGVLLVALRLSVPGIFRGVSFSLLSAALFSLNSFRRLLGLSRLKYQLKWNRNKREPMGFHPNNK